MLFDVTNDELNFLCEYYHSVVPVVLASPFFLLANYILLPLVIYSDNHLTYFGVTQMTRCLPKFFTSPTVFFLIVDFSITFLLFIMFIYEVLWEFFVFLLSDWFLVSLLCKYATDPLRHNSRAFVGWSMRCILFARSLMHRPGISFN